MAEETPAALLARTLGRDPGRPLFTQYDDRTGERVELSATTLDNWVAKTANLLQEADVADGSAAVLLPPHWQTAVVMLGCWTAGVAVAHGPRGAAPESARVAFAAPDRFAEATALGAEEVWGLSLAPLAAPVPAPPAGVTDYATEVRGQADRFSPYAPVRAETPALVGAVGPGGSPGSVSQAELVDMARDRAAELGIGPGDRLLVVVGADGGVRPLDWLLAPLAAGASVVLLRDPEPGAVDARADAELVTVRLP